MLEVMVGVCRRSHCAGQGSTDSSVALKSHLPLLYKEPEKPPGGGTFLHPFGYLHELSSINFSTLSKMATTTTTPLFNIRRKQRL